MLSNLSITNYALIDHLNVSFQSGFTTITGETGAGKSILLGGLALVLGKRADLQSLRDKDKKCVVEAEFDIGNYAVAPFFEDNGLDYETRTILRRELLPGGKSRAFINDSPVTLDVLAQLGDKLIDVHSQHQTLQLTDNDFQLKVIDALADNTALLRDYKQLLFRYQATLKELVKLQGFQENATKELAYNRFLLEELLLAKLQVGMQEDLEEMFEQLNNMETILELVAKSDQLLNDESLGIISTFTELKQVSGKLALFGNQFGALNERIQSALIELKDMASEFVAIQEKLETNPQLLEEVGGKLQLLYTLQKKHNAQDVAALISIRENLQEKVDAAANVESDLKEIRALLQSLEGELGTSAGSITARREKAIPFLKKQLEETLSHLGMPGTSFRIELLPTKDFKDDGKDELVFLLSANKGMAYGELKKVASGGELSRIMLTIKSILSRYEKLPTMMFDEIDTGVSGEISNKMADIMKGMSATMQVFAITHLPQVASQGDHHYKVYKEEEGKGISTKMKILSLEDRVLEIAEMLDGKTLSKSALAHARQLLN